MTESPAPLAVEEYRALRATIRERGTLRLLLIAVTFGSWAALAIAVPALLVVPVLGLIPLVVLAAGFEVVLAAHVGVERIGRFLQVHYETGSGLPGWEHAAMGLSAVGRGSGIDPLMTGLFAAAGVLNLAPIALLTAPGGPTIGGGLPLELVVYGLIHIAFLARIGQARRFVGRQRQRDLAIFQSAAGSTRRAD